MSEYGDLIYKERKARRIRQQTLARRIGVHNGTLVDIELGRLEVGIATFNKAIAAMDNIQSDSKEAVA